MKVYKSCVCGSGAVTFPHSELERAPMSATVVNVIDIGTANARFGLAGEAFPSALVPSAGMAQGKVVNPAALHKLVASHHGDRQHDAFVVDSVYADPLTFRRQWCEELMETIKVQGVAFAPSPVLSAFANARTTALVVDMGAHGCVASAVVDGWLLRDSNVEISPVGGNALDAFIKGKSKTDVAHIRTAREHADYKLPDGSEVADVLFSETPIPGLDHVPLHELAFTAGTRSTSDDLRRALLGSMVLCGGLSQTSHVAERLADGVSRMARKDQPRVICANGKDRAVSAWLGGSIVASLAVYQEMRISQSEYSELGLNIVMSRDP